MLLLQTRNTTINRSTDWGNYVYKKLFHQTETNLLSWWSTMHSVSLSWKEVTLGGAVQIKNSVWLKNSNNVAELVVVRPEVFSVFLTLFGPCLGLTWPTQDRWHLLVLLIIKNNMADTHSCIPRLSAHVCTFCSMFWQLCLPPSSLWAPVSCWERDRATRENQNRFWFTITLWAWRRFDGTLKHFAPSLSAWFKKENAHRRLRVCVSEPVRWVGAWFLWLVSTVMLVVLLFLWGGEQKAPGRAAVTPKQKLERVLSHVFRCRQLELSSVFLSDTQTAFR